MAADESTVSFSFQDVLNQTEDETSTPSPSIEKPMGGNFSMLISDSGKNFSEIQYTIYSTVVDFGAKGIGVGEVVRFTSPTPDWKLEAIEIIGWSGYNTTSKKITPDGNFLVEVRDEDTNLLYKFADTQNYYFASSRGPVSNIIEVPSISVPENFYIVFYDRGYMYIGAEHNNGTGNSYFAIDGRLVPAELSIGGNKETSKVNWLIRAIGG